MTHYTFRRPLAILVTAVVKGLCTPESASRVRSMEYALDGVSDIV
jgi:hypothetical protein